MSTEHRTRLSLETLEDRTVPALLLQLSSGGNLTAIFGVPSGDVLVSLTASDEVQIFEGLSNLGTYNVPGNLSINLGNTIDTDPDLTVDLNGFELSGSVAITLGNALFGYDLAVGEGTIDGNLTATTGNGPDTVVLGGVAAGGLIVQGSATLNTQNAFDAVSVLGSTIQGNLTVRGANNYQSNSIVEGFFTFDSSRESLPTIVGLNAGSSIAGTAVVTTGAGADQVTVGGDIAGHAIFNLGNGANTLNFGTQLAVNVLGNMAVIAGSGNDVLNFGGTAAALVAGNLTIVAGNGLNNATFTNATVLGSNLTYVGGNSIDTFTINGLTAPGARLTGIFGNGNDVVIWNALPVLLSAYLDGGFGFNTFTSPNAINFPITLRNFT